MAIDKNALFECTRSLWPANAEVSSLDALNSIYETNEALVPAGDDWRQVALWAFHQALAELGAQALAEGSAAVVPGAVPFAVFDKWMRSNLAKGEWGPDEWLAERTEWEADDLPYG